MLERVIEEQAKGDAQAASLVRAKIGDVLGSSLAGIVPGSQAALEVKEVLQGMDLWSQCVSASSFSYLLLLVPLSESHCL